jgi:MFS family permease
MPVFFLYFSQRLSLSQVLRLEAIYYLCIVLVEVPSGYFSDRYGRRLTLLIASAALFVAYVIFFFGDNFGEFAVAQAFAHASIRDIKHTSFLLMGFQSLNLA